MQCGTKSHERGGKLYLTPKEQILSPYQLRRQRGMFPNKSVRFLVCVIIMIMGSCPISSHASRASSPQIGKVEYVPGEILVKFKKGVSQREIRSVNALHQGRVLRELPKVKVLRLKLPPGVDVCEAAKSYQSHPEVEYAEPNYIYHPYMVPNDPFYTKQWALKKIEVEQAWDIQKGDKNVVIAIVDTGIDWKHPDLANKIWVNNEETDGNGIDDDGNGYVDDVRGWDTADEDNDPMDDYGHGTHCAGIAAAQVNNEEGIAGVAWNCRVMPVKIDSWDWEKAFTAMVCAEAILYAANNGAEVISMSWGGPADSFVIKDALAQAHSLGVVLIAAAGNSNDDFSGYPAAYHNVISVSATDYYDNKTFFSTYGAFVDVAAPGADIYSTYSIGGWYSGYTSMSGTSMAAPHVAGLAALLISHNPNLNNEQVRQIIQNSAEDKGDPGWDSYYGYGRVNAYRAIQQASESSLPLVAWIDSPHLNDTVNGTIEIRGEAWGTGFLRYEINVGKGITPDSWRNDGISLVGGEVKDGLLGKWDTTKVENGQYIIRLQVYDTRGRMYEDRISVIVEQEGDSIRASSMLFTSPLLNDVDRDRTMEIIQISTDWDWGKDLLNIFKYDGSQINENWPKEDSNFWYGWLGVLPAVGDIDGDGEPEILALGDGGMSLCAWRLNGDPMPGFPLSYPNVDVWSSPTIGDINKDGYLEIAFVGVEFDTTTYDSEYELCIIDGKGNLLPNWPQKFKGFYAFTDMTPALGDITGDGCLEIVVCTVGGEVYVFKSDGSLVSGWPQAMADAGYSNVALGDVDGDNRVEIVTVCPGWSYEKTMVYVWKGDGSLLSGWPKKVGGAPTHPALGNLDGIGGLEIVVGSTDHRVYAWHYDGTLVSGWPQEIGDTILYASPPAIGDLDGDGRVEVVMSGGRDNKVYAWQSDGSPLSGWPKDTGSYNVTAPAIGDVDGDGKIDVIATSADGKIYIWHCSGRYYSEAVDWAMCAHDERNTCFATYRVRPTGELLSKAMVYNYPNPARGNVTNFRYYVDRDADITIKIYNIAGELVDKLEGQGIGGRQDNEITWDISRIASGVYIYQLQARSNQGSKTVIKKLAVIK